MATIIVVVVVVVVVVVMDMDELVVTLVTQLSIVTGQMRLLTQ